MCCPLSHGDDADFGCGLGVDNDHDIGIEEADGDKAFFAVVEPVVGNGEGRPGKYLAAEEKSRPCFMIFAARLVSSQVNFMDILYIFLCIRKCLPTDKAGKGGLHLFCDGCARCGHTATF
jgi:hypothetical protein